MKWVQKKAFLWAVWWEMQLVELKERSLALWTAVLMDSLMVESMVTLSTAEKDLTMAAQWGGMLGAPEGSALGAVEGRDEGAPVGFPEGSFEGTAVGCDEGHEMGCKDGCTEG